MQTLEAATTEAGPDLRCPLAPHVQTKGCLCPTACSCPPGLAQPRTLTLLLSFNFLWGRGACGHSLLGSLLLGLLRLVMNF